MLKASKTEIGSVDQLGTFFAIAYIVMVSNTHKINFNGTNNNIVLEVKSTKEEQT
jgi:hypothetical protein